MKDKFVEKAVEPVEVEQKPTMSLNDVLREISYLQWIIAREDGDVTEARDTLQNMYEMRDKMVALQDE